jgi:hypothetical protein
MTSSATHLSPSERDRVFEVLLRFVRTPSFLVRHFDLARDHDSAMLAAAFEREDESGLPLRQSATGVLVVTNLTTRCGCRTFAS